MLSLSCSRGGSPTTPVTPSNVSTFNITFNGKTFPVADDNANTVALNATTGSSSGGFIATIIAEDDAINAFFYGSRVGFSSAVGTYHLDDIGIGSGGATITDYADGGKVYQVVGPISTTANAIIISASNSTQVKGTFKLQLEYAGVTYPATGDFDVKQ